MGLLPLASTGACLAALLPAVCLHPCATACRQCIGSECDKLEQWLHNRTYVYNVAAVWDNMFAHNGYIQLQCIDLLNVWPHCCTHDSKNTGSKGVLEWTQLATWHLQKPTIDKAFRHHSTCCATATAAAASKHIPRGTCALLLPCDDDVEGSSAV